GRAQLACRFQRPKVARGISLDGLEERLGAIPGVCHGTIALVGLRSAQETVELRERLEQVQHISVTEPSDLLVGEVLRYQEPFEREGERSGPIEHRGHTEAVDGRIARRAIEGPLQVAPGDELIEV